MNLAPDYMLDDRDAFGTFCPRCGTLVTRTHDGTTRTDPHCRWNGHLPAIETALDELATIAHRLPS